MYYSLLVLFIFLGVNNLGAQEIFENLADKKWVKKYDAEGLLIFVNENCPKGKTELKAEIVIDKDCSLAINELKPKSSNAYWMYMIEEAKVLNSPSSTKTIMWYEIDMPWPISNQDIVTTSVFSVKKNGDVILYSKATPNAYQSKGFERINYSEDYYLFTFVNDNKCKIEYGSRAGNDGYPEWMINLFITDLPKKNLNNLKDRCLNMETKQQDLNWLYK